MENEQFEDVPKNPLKILQKKLESLFRSRPSNRDSIEVLLNTFRKILDERSYFNAYYLTQSFNKKTYDAKVEIGRILFRVSDLALKIPFPSNNKERAFSFVYSLYADLNTVLILLSFVNTDEEPSLSFTRFFEPYKSNVERTILNKK